MAELHTYSIMHDFDPFNPVQITDYPVTVSDISKAVTLGNLLVIAMVVYGSYDIVIYTNVGTDLAPIRGALLTKDEDFSVNQNNSDAFYTKQTSPKRSIYSSISFTKTGKYLISAARVGTYETADYLNDINRRLLTLDTETVPAEISARQNADNALNLAVSKKNSFYHTATLAAMDALTGMIAGDLCSVDTGFDSKMSIYRYDGEAWLLVQYQAVESGGTGDVYSDVSATTAGWVAVAANTSGKHITFVGQGAFVPIGKWVEQHVGEDNPATLYGGTWINCSSRAVIYALSDTSGGAINTALGNNGWVFRYDAGQSRLFTDADLAVGAQIASGAYTGKYVVAVRSHAGLFHRVEGGGTKSAENPNVSEPFGVPQLDAVQDHMHTQGFINNWSSYAAGQGFATMAAYNTGGMATGRGDVETRPANLASRLWAKQAN